MIQRLKIIFQGICILLKHKNVVVVSHDDTRHSFYIYSDDAQDTIDVISQILNEHIPDEAEQELALQRAKEILNN